MNLVLLSGNSLSNKEWILRVEKKLTDLNIKNYQLVEMPGAEHYYGELEEIRDLMVDFLS